MPIGMMKTIPTVKWDFVGLCGTCQMWETTYLPVLKEGMGGRIKWGLQRARLKNDQTKELILDMVKEGD